MEMKRTLDALTEKVPQFLPQQGEWVCQWVWLLHICPAHRRS